MKSTTRLLAEADVDNPVLPDGEGERFAGYGVMGMPFVTGHYLAMRHFPASSVGPGYRAVWHRDPTGRWVVYADAPPQLSCARYLGSALSEANVANIATSWTGSGSLTVLVDDTLVWSMEMAGTAATWLLSTIGARLPDWAWRSTVMLRSIGLAAGPLLSIGAMRLTGLVPNGQTFRASPRHVSTIPRASATLYGKDLGPQGPLPQQDRLGDFWLPQRAIFFADATVGFTAPSMR